MFLEIAEKKYPQSLDLASSLNSIFANLGISLGSLTAAQTVEFTSLANVGYIGALYGFLATGGCCTTATEQIEQIAAYFKDE